MAAPIGLKDSQGSRKAATLGWRLVPLWGRGIACDQSQACMSFPGLVRNAGELPSAKSRSHCPLSIKRRKENSGWNLRFDRRCCPKGAMSRGLGSSSGPRRWVPVRRRSSSCHWEQGVSQPTVWHGISNASPCRSWQQQAPLCPDRTQVHSWRRLFSSGQRGV